jgi:hypothetical protein
MWFIFLLFGMIVLSFIGLSICNYYESKDKTKFDNETFLQLDNYETRARTSKDLNNLLQIRRELCDYVINNVLEQKFIRRAQVIKNYLDAKLEGFESAKAN